MLGYGTAMKNFRRKLLKKCIIGIDEAGRGPLAGPIAVCAFRVFNKKILKCFPDNCDSKKVSVSTREKIYRKAQQLVRSGDLDFKVVLVSSKYIDKFGIEEATRKGIKEALDKLKAKPQSSKIMLDGRLKAPKKFTYQQTIVKGDSLQKEIGLASIVAKVRRDNYMQRQAKKFPLFGFEYHKGYGTAAHLEVITKYGPTEIHRMSYLKKFLA
jgi:ribonuclease HII